MSFSGILINNMDITEQGLNKLKKELEELKTTKRKELAERLRAAIAMGDLSENFDYKDAKDQQVFLEGRIKELGEMINSANVVSKKKNSNVVQLGSNVVLKDGKEEFSYEIVGATEADPLKGKLSIDSPIGQTLIGKKVGDIAVVETPSGKMEYTVKGIS